MSNKNENNRFNFKRFINFIKYDSKKIIDNIIISFFYLTIVVATIHAGYKIVSEAFFNEKSLNKSKCYTNDLLILEFVEHVFLYLIPIFILLGFYSYYKFDLRLKLLNLGTPSGIDQRAMMDSIHLSKSLFLSSITSYVIIKVIEKIFFQCETNGSYYEIKPLISYGVLLIILIIYTVFQNKIHDH